MTHKTRRNLAQIPLPTEAIMPTRFLRQKSPYNPNENGPQITLQAA